MRIYISTKGHEIDAGGCSISTTVPRVEPRGDEISWLKDLRQSWRVDIVDALSRALPQSGGVLFELNCHPGAAFVAGAMSRRNFVDVDLRGYICMLEVESKQRSRLMVTVDDDDGDGDELHAVLSISTPVFQAYQSWCARFGGVFTRSRLIEFQPEGGPREDAVYPSNLAPWAREMRERISRAMTGPNQVVRIFFSAPPQLALALGREMAHVAPVATMDLFHTRDVGAALRSWRDNSGFVETFMVQHAGSPFST